MGEIRKNFIKVLSPNYFKKEDSESEAGCSTRNASGREKPISPNVDLQQGKYLTGKLKEEYEIGDFNDNLLFEEIDPWYKGKQTFLAIGPSQIIYRFGGQRSLIFFHSLESTRKQAIEILTSANFSYIVAFIVILHCHMIPWFVDMSSTVYQILRWLFMALYLAEMSVKIVARGLILHKFSYLRSLAGWTDVAVLVSIILGIKGAPILKLLFLIPQSQPQLNYLVSEGEKRLGGFFSYLFIVLFLSATITCQLYMGLLTNKCIKSYPSDRVLYWSWEDFTNNEALWLREEKGFRICGNYSGATSCPDDFTCLQGYGKSPENGFTSFDTIGSSVLTIFRIISRDLVPDLYEKIYNAYGSSQIVTFFVLFICGTYTLNVYGYTIILKCLFGWKTENRHIFVQKLLNKPTTTVVHEGLNTVNADETTERVTTWRKRLEKFVNSSFYRKASLLVLLIDILAMCSIHNGVSLDAFFALSVIIKVCQAFYILDMGLQISTQYKNFPQTWFTIFEFGIVLLIICDWITQSGLISALLTIRFFKILPQWNHLSTAIQIMLKSFKYFPSMFISCFTFMTFFGYLGTQLSIYTMPNSYSHFMWSTFTIFTGQWNDPLWHCLESGQNPASCISFVIIVTIFMKLMWAFCFYSVVFTTETILNTGETENVTIFPCGRKLCTAVKQKCTACSDCIEGRMENLRKRFFNLRETSPDSENGRNVHLQRMSSEWIATDNISNEDGISFREKCALYQETVTVKVISVLLICVMVVALALELSQAYGEKHEALFNVLSFWIRSVFSGFFGISMLMQVVGRGIRTGLTLSSALDSIILTEINLSLAFGWENHLVRSFVPFMLISRFDFIKVPFVALWSQMKYLFPFVGITLFTWCYLAVFGIHLFRGSFNHGIKEGFNTSSCFANAIVSMTTISSIVSLHPSWISAYNKTLIENECSHNFENSTDPNPNFLVHGKSEAFITYCYLLGGFIMFSILTGALYHYLKNCHQGTPATMFMTIPQAASYVESRENIIAKITCNSQQDDPNENIFIQKPFYLWQEIIFNMINHPAFIVVTMLLISVDVVSIASREFQMTNQTLQIIYDTITFIYVIELILKLLGWRRYYFQSGWNQYDLFVTVYSVIGLFTESLLDYYFVPPTIFRILRIIKVFVTVLNILKIYSVFRLAYLLIGMKNFFRNLLTLYAITFVTFVLLGLTFFRDVKTKEGGQYFDTVLEGIKTVFGLSMGHYGGTVAYNLHNKTCKANSNASCMVEMIQAFGYIYTFSISVWMFYTNFCLVVIQELLMLEEKI